jgi:hypothetical protein
MLFNLKNTFEDRRVQFPSFYWFMYFSDLHITLLKSDRQLLGTFPKSFVNSKAFGVKQLRTY